MINISKLGKLLLVSAFILALISVTATLVNGESVLAVQKGAAAIPSFQLDAANKQALINGETRPLLVEGSPSVISNYNDPSDVIIKFNNNGDSYEIPETADLFEEGEFSISLDVLPDPNNFETQYIIDHFNWSLYMPSPHQLTFRVGRMNDGEGDMYKVNAKFERPLTDWINVVAVYSPKDEKIEIYVDGEFINKESIGQNKIFGGYGTQNLKIAASQHGENKYTYTGSVRDIKIFPQALTKANIVKLNIDNYQFLTPTFLIAGTVALIILAYLVAKLIGKSHKSNAKK